jgi:short-subunit dehydrogenase
MAPLALVTGGSSGLGLELARLLAADGHDLLLVARGAAALEEAAAELRAGAPVRCETFVCDLARLDERERLAAHLASLGRPVDVLVNNAGFGLHGDFAATDISSELRMIDVNVAALTHLAKLVLPSMLARRSGRIMNLGSVASFMPGPLMSVYYASKAYVLSFSLALSEETEGSGVTVTVFCPGTVITNFQRTAGLDPAAAARVPTLMDAATTARVGYEAMMRGERLVIPGSKNRRIVALSRFLPRRTLARMVKRVQEARRPKPAASR